MAYEDLTEKDKKLYEYIKANDFVSKKWSTPDTARKLEMTEDEVYQSLVNLMKHIKEKIQINYKDGGLRIIAE